MDPQIKFFQTACITDNAAGVVLLPDATERADGLSAQRGGDPSISTGTA
jgi:hypothetical protein